MTSVDLEEDLVDRAKRALATAGYPQVVPLAGDGWEGAAEGAPFDRIEVTVGVWDLSPRWVEQLADEGLLVVPLWLSAGAQASIAFRKSADRLVSESVHRCGFMRLRGPQAGPEAYAPVKGWLPGRGPPGDIELLGTLLATEPRQEDIASPPEGWFERLALEDPRAIRLVTSEAHYRDAAGIFDREARSLSLIEEGVLLSFGKPDARYRLKEFLNAGEPLSLERLRVEAAPSLDSPGSWVLRRPEFAFVLTGGSPPRSERAHENSGS